MCTLHHHCTGGHWPAFKVNYNLNKFTAAVWNLFDLVEIYISSDKIYWTKLWDCWNYLANWNRDHFMMQPCGGEKFFIKCWRLERAYFVTCEYFSLVEGIFCCPWVFFVGGKHILLPKSRNFFIRLARGEQGHVTEDWKHFIEQLYVQGQIYFTNIRRFWLKDLKYFIEQLDVIHFFTSIWRFDWNIEKQIWTLNTVMPSWLFWTIDSRCIFLVF